MKLKLPFIDTDDKHNKFFPSFSFFNNDFKPGKCYESKLKGLSNETTLVLSNTRELDRVPDTK